MRERIELRVYNANDLTVHLETIAQRWDPTELEELNREGGGSFKIRRDDPLLVEDPTLLQEGRVVEVRVKGATVQWFEINKISEVLIDDGEFEGRWKQFSGPGLLHWLDHALVLPESAGLQLSDQRMFNYGARRDTWYVPAQWKGTVLGGAPRDRTSFWYKSGKYPKGWPKNLNAGWIWDRAQSATSWPPAGDAYIRREFTTSATADYRIVASADDYAQILVDGVQAMAITDFSAATRTYTVDLTLPAGSHVIAAKVRQIRTSTGTGGRGGAGLLLALCKIVDDKTTENLTATDRVVYTGDSYSAWVINAYPVKPPGFTVGGILKTLFDEAVARGVTRLAKLTLGFTATVDSYGVAWADTVDPSFRVGDSLLDVVKELTDGYVDVWVSPDLKLHCAPVRGKDRSVPVAGADPIAFRRAQNVVDAKTSSTAEIANYAFMKTPYGLVGKAGPVGSVSQFGVREAYLSTDDPTDLGTSQALLVQLFNKFGMPRRTPTLKIYPDDTSQPYRDFGVGDWVLAPSDTDRDVLVKRRIVSIAVEEDDGSGEVSYTCEIDTIQESYEERVARWLKTLDNTTKSGGVSGTSKPGSLKDLPSITAPSQMLPVPIPEDDRLPTPPGALAVSADIVPDDRGVPVGRLSGSWTADGLADDGTDLQVRTFEVYYRTAGVGLYRLLTLTPFTSFTASPLPVRDGTGAVLSYEVYVVAVGTNGYQSQPSELVQVTMSADTEAPLQPSKPTAIAVRGVFTVFWDGLDLNGSPMARDLDYAEVQRRTSTGPDVWADVGKMGKATSLTVGSLPYGPQTFRLVAYDVTGNASPPSAEATATSTPLVDDSEFALKWTELSGDIAGVQTSLNGKSSISASAPTAGDLAGKPANATWTQIVGGKVVGAWYKASDTAPGWSPMPFDPVMIPQIAIGAGTFGTLDGVRLTAKSVTTDQMIIGSGTNLLTDPDMEDPANWIPNFAGAVTATGGKTGHGSLLVPASALQQGAYYGLNAGPRYGARLVQGGTYRMGAWVYPSANVPVGGVKLFLRLHDEANGFLLATDVPTNVPQNAAVLPANTWSFVTGMVTVPAGTANVYGVFGMYKQAAYSTGSALFSDPVMQQAAAGELLVDGSIKALKLDVNNVFADTAVVGKLNAQIGTFLTNADGTGMVSTVTGQGLRVTYTDPVTGDVQDRIKVGTFDDDMIALSDTNGTQVVTMNSKGQIGAISGEFSGTISLAGEDLGETLKSMPAGIKAWRQFPRGDSYPWPTLGSAGGEVGLFEIGWDTQFDTPPRMYKVNVPKILLKSLSGAATHLGLTMRYTTDGTPPTVASAQLIEHDWGYASAGGYRSAGFNDVMIGSQNGPYIRVLISLWANGGASVDNAGLLSISVDDDGYYIDPTGSYTTGGVTPNSGTNASAPSVPVVTAQKDFVSNGVRSFLANDSQYGYNQTKAYQGLSPAGYGNLRSMYCYPSVTGYLTGATIKGIWVYLYFEHWYANAGGTARIGLHPNSSIPGTWNTSNTVQITVPGWAKGTGRWVLLPSSTYEGFRTGAWKGVTLLGDSSYSTYGIANASKLRIKYVK